MLWINVVLWLRARRWVPRRLVYELFFLYGADIPAQVRIGESLKVEHRGMGVVIHPCTVIGDRVRIWHGVTIGRADPHVEPEGSAFKGFVVEDDVLLCSGAKVLGGAGTTTVGRGTIVAANAVLLQSTGDWEVWAGVPARKVGARRRPVDQPVGGHQNGLPSAAPGV